MSAFDLKTVLSARTIEALEIISNDFQSAKPFKHTVIENFFAESIAEGLLSDFPGFDEKNALNEFGLVGGKASFRDVKALSPSYRLVDQAMASPELLGFIGEITDIPDLIYDPKYFGGGTHENRHGQELDPHVDFNYQENRWNHRRLNLIVYLNKKWEPEWGGQIEIQSNPRDPEHNIVKAINPDFNRCVIFETNEISWHGFPEIRLPADHRNRSRKSFAVYFYSRGRPDGEVAPPHGTFYVSRPLPDPLYAKMDAETAKVVKIAVKRRDNWISFYQKKELEWRGQIQALLGELINPAVSGPVEIIGIAEGHHRDHWLGPEFLVRLRSKSPISSLLIELYFPPEHTDVFPLTISCYKRSIIKESHADSFVMHQLDIAVGTDFDLSIRFRNGYTKDGVDCRTLSAVLTKLAFH